MQFDDDFDALADFSSLKREVVAGLDIMIVRELTSGVYFGEPRGIVTEGNQRVAEEVVARFGAFLVTILSRPRCSCHNPS